MNLSYQVKASGTIYPLSAELSQANLSNLQEDSNLIFPLFLYSIGNSSDTQVVLTKANRRTILDISLNKDFNLADRVTNHGVEKG